MKTIGIIAEFNPFHNGHRYIIEEAKRQTHATHAVIVMSGNYVQRGGPAVLDKHIRTQIALQNGADLVIELPFYFSMAKAEHFAYGAIQIFNQLGIIDTLCFGCEHAKLADLETIATLSANEPEPYKQELKKHLQSGLAYSRAKELAMTQYLQHHETYSITDNLLNLPNNILGIEYLTAMQKTGSTFQAHCIQRIDCGYHSTESTQVNDTHFASATAIREKFLNNDLSYGSYVPENAIPLYHEAFQNRYPITEDDFSSIIGYTLCKAAHTDRPEEYFDLSEFVSNRIFNKKSGFKTVREFISQLTSKSITAAYLRRGLFQMMLGFTQTDYQTLVHQEQLPYISILGFNKKGAELLKFTKELQTPVIINHSKAANMLSPFGLYLYHKTQIADDIYRMTVQNKYGQELPSEQALYHKNIFNS